MTASAAPTDLSASHADHLLAEISARIAAFNAEHHPGFGYARDQFVEPLRLFLEDHSDKSAQELAELADKLTPGGAHNDGLLVRLVRANLWLPCPRLVAATMYRAWHGGKAGFQFLPDPASVDFDEYEAEVCDLIEAFDEGAPDPRMILVDDDVAFYESLPDRFRIYRGCAGVTADVAAAGVCWSTRREIAEWFASRAVHAGGTPVLVAAWVRKDNICLARATEYEIVTQATGHRELKCRPQSKPADMVWGRARPT